MSDTSQTQAKRNTSPLKILVFCPNWVGDAVMATPALRALRHQFPSAHIAGLMKSPIADTLEGSAVFDEWIIPGAGRKSLFSLIGRLRQSRFDIAVLLTNSFRSALLAWLGGAKQRVGYAREGRSLLLTDRLFPKLSRHGYVPTPIIDYYLALAYSLGAEPVSYQMELETSPTDEARCDRLWSKFGFKTSDRVLAINPGAAFGPAKRWPSLYFAELCRRLCELPGIRVLILCGPNERGFARYIADASMKPRWVKSMAEEDVSLGLTKAIVKRSSLLVTTDSGPRHFAAAFNVPVVSLFGPTHQEWTDTYFAKETPLQVILECGPCQQRSCPLGHHRCMTELTVDQVHAEVLKKLFPESAKSVG